MWDGVLAPISARLRVKSKRLEVGLPPPWAVFVGVLCALPFSLSVPGVGLRSVPWWGPPSRGLCGPLPAVGSSVIAWTT